MAITLTLDLDKVEFLEHLMHLRTDAGDRGDNVLAAALSIAWAVQFERVYGEGTLRADESVEYRTEWFTKVRDRERSSVLT